MTRRVPNGTPEVTAAGPQTWRAAGGRIELPSGRHVEIQMPVDMTDAEVLAVLIAVPQLAAQLYAANVSQSPILVPSRPPLAAVRS